LAEALYMLPDDVGEPLLQQAIISSSADVRFAAALALVSRGDLDALKEVLGQYPTISDTHLRSMALGAIADGFRNTADDSIQFLGELATGMAAHPLEVRRASASALRAIHTRETLPYLAQLLESPDGELRYLGMSGLSCFAHALPMKTRRNQANMGYLRPQVEPELNRFKPEDERQIPLVGDYAAAQPFLDEPQALALWRQWWSQYRPELGR
jgi:HEAT repeat protein